MTRRAWGVMVVAGLSLVALAACGGKTPSSPGGVGAPTAPASQVVGSTGPAAPTTPAAPATTTTPPKPAVKAITCTQVRNGHLGSATVPYNGYPDYIPLLDGVWSGEDGNTVEVKVCGTGDLNHDGAVDALAGIELSGGGTGHFWSLGYWRNSGGSPVFAALKDLDDRTPVQSITISGNKATVVWLTRGPSDPMAAVTIKRTSVFTLSGSTLTEVSHMDQPYTAS